MTEPNLIPALCSVPIVGLNPDGTCGPFLGSGAFIGEQKILVTCDHVLAQWDGRYGFSAHEDEPQLYELEVKIRDSSSDLALLQAIGYQPPYSFPLAENSEIILNQLVCAFEYGTTEVAGGQINFTPANRMGNVTRLRNMTEQYATAGDHMLELSFPALKGASGAPIVLHRPPFSVWGVITANVARELMTAHIERILDEDGNLTEETKFYLPQALAIHVMHIRRLIESVAT